MTARTLPAGMRLLVTGALGGLGRWVVADLAAAGHDVIAVDRDRPTGRHRTVDFVAADLARDGVARELCTERRPDAVVHLAAIPTDGVAPGSEIVRTNVAATYNVLSAAGAVDAPAVWTSSESVLGSVFAPEPWLPDSLPVDESHPTRPADPYGLSKVAGEEVAKMVARRYGTTTISLRPSWVTFPGAGVITDVQDRFDLTTAEPNGNFWTHVDVRDVVSAIRAALEADVDGHEAYYLAADRNFLGIPTRELVETTFGGLPDDCELEGEASAFSTAKAERELGWQPAHGWRDAEGEEPFEPTIE